jgi:hypothetical protein
VSEVREKRPEVGCGDVVECVEVVVVQEESGEMIGSV